MHTEFYTPAVEGGVRHDDPRLAIDWPLAVTDLSERDRNHASLTDAFTGIDS
jgi:dTDP-4-dehydrorhamnose 3,5-epimerase